MISDDDIKKLALLARLYVSEEEASRLPGQLGAILDYFGELKAYDVSNVAATSHAQGLTNVFRDDQNVASLSSKDVVKMAPDISGTFIRVPIIIDHEE